MNLYGWWEYWGSVDSRNRGFRIIETYDLTRCGAHVGTRP